MPPMLVMLVLVGSGAVVWMIGFYVLRRLVRNVGLADVGWTLGVGLAAIAYAPRGRETRYADCSWRRLPVRGAFGSACIFWQTGYAVPRKTAVIRR